MAKLPLLKDAEAKPPRPSAPAAERLPLDLLQTELLLQHQSEQAADAARALASTRFILASHLKPFQNLQPGDFSLRDCVALAVRTQEHIATRIRDARIEAIQNLS